MRNFIDMVRPLVENPNKTVVYHGDTRPDFAPHAGSFYSSERGESFVEDYLPLYDPETDRDIETFDEYYWHRRSNWGILETDGLIDQMIGDADLAGMEIYENGVRNYYITDVSVLTRVDDMVTEKDEPLDMSVSARMARATQQGFTIPAYHGTGAKFDSFDLDKGKPSIMGGFAPHFSLRKAEADGYKAGAGKGARTLSCLLRVSNPFTVDMNQTIMSDRDEYKALVGKDWDGDDNPSKWRVLDHMVNANLSHDRRTMWVNIYAALKKRGYDGILYKDMLADFADGQYDKMIVFDPRNIRLRSAAFDPANSQSTNIKA